MDARRELARLLGTRQQPVHLFRAALCLEQEEIPDVDAERLDAQIRGWAETIDSRLGGARAPLALAERLAELLFVELGFKGAAKAFDDAAASHLSRVVERRVGIPISLSMIYLGIGFHLNAAVAGVGFPGHFLVRIGDERRGVLVDPFHQGIVLDREAAEKLLRTKFGAHAVLEPQHLEPSTPRAVLARLQRNLKMLYMKQNNDRAALAASDRIVFLLPDEPEELRDRGLLYERLECFAAAQRDYEGYLEQRGASDDAASIRERLLATSQRAALVH